MTRAFKAFAIAAALSAVTTLACAADDDVGAIQMAYEPSIIRLGNQGWYPLVVQLAAGWRGSRYWAVEAFASPTLTIETAGKPGPDYFSSVVGLRGVGYLPVSDRWELMAKVGVASTTLNHSDAVGHVTITDPVVGGGLMWHGGPHLSVGANATWLTKSHTPMVGARLEWRL